MLPIIPAPTAKPDKFKILDSSGGMLFSYVELLEEAKVMAKYLSIESEYHRGGFVTITNIDDDILFVYFEGEAFKKEV